jgi:hypothetical protein
MSNLTANSDAPIYRLLSVLSGFVERGGPQPEEYSGLARLFDELVAYQSENDLKAVNDFAKQSNGAFNSTETNQGFGCLRPHDYYGGFEIIDRIYTGRISDDERLKRWDKFFHWSSAPRAVRARKD